MSSKGNNKFMRIQDDIKEMIDD